jgi:hypothetical protein
MARTERRLERLEAAFEEARGPRDVERELFRQALRRLNAVELAVMLELLDFERDHPDRDGGERWHAMTEVHRAFWHEWSRAVNAAGRAMQEEDPSLTDAQKEAIRICVVHSGHPFMPRVDIGVQIDDQEGNAR